MSQRHCPNCGRGTEEGANFCSHCGTRLEGDESTVTLVDLEGSEESGLEVGELPSLEAGQGVLVVIRGPNQGSRYFLENEVTTVGRHPDSDIQLDDVTVSRRHAELSKDPEGYFFIKDAGSLNGTYVNKKRVDQARLSTGDEIQIGRYKLVFVAGAEAARGPAPPSTVV
ncbi:MAG: hypothetical protein C4318_07835 [Acidimicrobiia bacterium]